jgi:hypothetical protein
MKLCHALWRNLGMGSWGADTFQSDTALDFLGDTIAGIVRVIDADLEAARSDDIIERPVMAAVAILRVLAQNFRSAAIIISRSKVQVWREEYLKWFDAKMPSASKVYEAEREIVEKEFDGLLACPLWSEDEGESTR